MEFEKPHGLVAWMARRTNPSSSSKRSVCARVFSLIPRSLFFLLQQHWKHALASYRKSRISRSRSADACQRRKTNTNHRMCSFADHPGFDAIQLTPPRNHAVHVDFDRIPGGHLSHSHLLSHEVAMMVVIRLMWTPNAPTCLRPELRKCPP